MNVITLQEVGNAAIAIGLVYTKARRGSYDALALYAETGRMLLEEKPEHSRTWGDWLRQNETALGFDQFTAIRLMRLGEIFDASVNYTDAELQKLYRGLWGHEKDSQLVQQSLSNEHYTPDVYIEAARAVMGSIDVDPASCDEANRLINAKVYYDKEKDGLQQPWDGNVWLNPPYGDDAGAFVAKLTEERAARRARDAIVLVNAHCTDTKWFQPLWDGCLCFTDHRINFYGDDERSGSTHGSMFSYFGKKQSRFYKQFCRFGPILVRR